MFVKSKGEGTFQCIHVNVCFDCGIGLSHWIRVYGWLDWTVSQNLFHTERSCVSHGFDTALQTGIRSTQLSRRLDHFLLFFPMLLFVSNLYRAPLCSSRLLVRRDRKSSVSWRTCDTFHLWNGLHIRSNHQICMYKWRLGGYSQGTMLLWVTRLSFLLLIFWGVRVSNVNMKAAFDYIF